MNLRQPPSGRMGPDRTRGTGRSRPAARVSPAASDDPTVIYRDDPLVEKLIATPPEEVTPGFVYNRDHPGLGRRVWSTPPAGGGFDYAMAPGSVESARRLDLRATASAARALTARSRARQASWTSAGRGRLCGSPTSGRGTWCGRPDRQRVRRGNRPALGVARRAPRRHDAHGGYEWALVDGKFPSPTPRSHGHPAGSSRNRREAWARSQISQLAIADTAPERRSRSTGHDRRSPNGPRAIESSRTARECAWAGRRARRPRCRRTEDRSTGKSAHRDRTENGPSELIDQHDGVEQVEIRDVASGTRSTTPYRRACPRLRERAHRGGPCSTGTPSDRQRGQNARPSKSGSRTNALFIAVPTSAVVE